MNLLTNPVCVPSDDFVTAFASGAEFVPEESLCFADAVSDATASDPRSCARHTIPVYMLTASTAMFFQVFPPRTTFSGTTMVSPGPTAAESTLPDHSLRSWPVATEPSARMIKMAPLFASCAAPPARERYQPAFLP